MARSTVDFLVNEICDRCGGRDEFKGAEAGTPPAGRAIRALNDAYQRVVMTYKLPQFESETAWTFASSVYQTGTASTTGTDQVAINGNGTSWNTPANASVGWYFKFDADSTWSEIVAVGGDTSLTVSPRIPTAHALQAYTIVKTMWQMPTTNSGSPSDVFSILSVREMEQQRKIKAADYRLLDRIYPVTDVPLWYVRLGDKFLLWPVPDVPNIYYRVRYLVRPPYKALATSPATTLAPLPEEWEQVVVLKATGMVLAECMELEMGQAFETASDAIAQTLMNPANEQSEDFEMALRSDPLFARDLESGGR